MINPILGGVLFGLIPAFAWGIGDFLGASLSKKIGLFKFIYWVYVIFFIYYLILLPFYISSLVITPQIIIYSITGGFLHFSAAYVFYLGAEKANFSIISAIGSSYSLILLIGGLLFLGEILSSGQIIIIVLLILSIVLISLDLKSILQKKFSLTDKSVVFGLGAMFGWGLGYLFLNPVIDQTGWFLPNFILSSIGFTAVNLIMIKRRENVKIGKVKGVYLSLIIQPLLALIGYWGYSMGVKSYPTTIVGPISSGFAVVTIILVWLVFKEKLSITQRIGVFGVVGCVILLSVVG